jgi:DNA polymerase-3 subunit epsilon
MGSLLARFFRLEESDLPESVRHHRSLRRRIDLRKRIKDCNFAAFDTELTGLDFKKDSVISIGALKMKGSRIFPGKVFYRLVKPEADLSSESVVVHGITHSDLADAENLQSVLADFIDFIGDSVLIGHFVFIDLNFLNRAMKRFFGFSLRNPVIDTYSIHDWLYENDSRFARHFNGMTLKKDLFSMAKRYGIRVQTAHNALIDAYITAQLFQRFISFLPDCGINTLEELLMVGKP